MANQHLRRRGNANRSNVTNWRVSDRQSCSETSSLLGRGSRAMLAAARSGGGKALAPSAAYDAEALYRVFRILSGCACKLAADFRLSVAAWLRKKQSSLAANTCTEPTAGTLEALRVLRAHRSCAFDRTDAGHEGMLREVWGLLQPDVEFERVSTNWESVGFQGRDPATDFRGQGLLGLLSLLHLCRHHTGAARGMLSRHGFPLAIAAINISSFLTKLVEKHAGLVGNALFAARGASEGGEADAVEAFNELFCLTFLHFERVHTAAVTAYLDGGGLPALTVMQFNAIRAKFFVDLENDVNQGKYNDVFGARARGSVAVLPGR